MQSKALVDCFFLLIVDLVDEYQQYQEATADDDEDEDEDDLDHDGEYWRIPKFLMVAIYTMPIEKTMKQALKTFLWSL